MKTNTGMSTGLAMAKTPGQSIMNQTRLEWFAIANRQGFMAQVTRDRRQESVKYGRHRHEVADGIPLDVHSSETNNRTTAGAEDRALARGTGDLESHG